MPSHPLAGMRILVLEDDYLIARDTQRELEDAGAVVVGPVRNVEQAAGLIVAGAAVDGCILDVNLDGESSFKLAELLQRRAIPFLFATGYAPGDLPEEWRHARIETKPLRIAAVTKMFR